MRSWHALYQHVIRLLVFGAAQVLAQEKQEAQQHEPGQVENAVVPYGGAAGIIGAQSGKTHFLVEANQGW